MSSSIDLPSRNADFDGIEYPAHYSPERNRYSLSYTLLCSYEEVAKAISAWGTLEKVLVASSGLNHTFIVRFKEDIKFTYDSSQGVMVNMCAGGVFHSLRGMYEGGSTRGQILSSKRIAFDINKLGVSRFCDRDIRYYQDDFPPNAKLKQIKAKLGDRATRDMWKQELERSFTTADKAELLLDWIRSAGERIAREGIYRSGNDPALHPSVLEIVENYTTPSWSDWRVVYHEKGASKL